MTENGYNEEEMKMVKETKKIWGDNDVSITATCIRVPIMRAHAESINLEFDRDVSEDEVSHKLPLGLLQCMWTIQCKMFNAAVLHVLLQDEVQ